MNNHKIKVYTAGNMEVSDGDMGAGWRNKLTPFLIDLGFEVHDPVKFESEKLKNFKTNQMPEYITHWQTNEKIKPKHWHEFKNAKEPNIYARFQRYMEQIIKYDLKIVRGCDLIIVNWSKETRLGGGTYGELTVAKDMGIPVYAVVTTDVPGWIMGTFKERFSSFDELKEFLTEEYGE